MDPAHGAGPAAAAAVAAAPWKARRPGAPGAAAREAEGAGAPSARPCAGFGAEHREAGQPGGGLHGGARRHHPARLLLRYPLGRAAHGGAEHRLRAELWARIPRELHRQLLRADDGGQLVGLRPGRRRRRRGVPPHRVPQDGPEVDSQGHEHPRKAHARGRPAGARVPDSPRGLPVRGAPLCAPRELAGQAAGMAALDRENRQPPGGVEAHGVTERRYSVSGGPAGARQHPRDRAAQFENQGGLQG
mmetsp:Transcript_35271/g.112192  ORF Transcript_35271/g.112192 Transcript_35271/m.112192 type:complete len:246 (+) Transcript_35271:1109-1846(+)